VTETTVKRVVDGDTIEVVLGGKKEKVRLIGVNTPETHHPSKPVEEYGPEAEEFTRAQLEGKTVYLEFDVAERDQYGRILAYVWVEKPQSEAAGEIRAKMFNARLLAEGYAQVMTVPPNVKYAEVFAELQAEAREAGRGLWGAESFAPGSAPGSEPSMASNGKQNTGHNAEQSGFPDRGPNGETIKGNINSKGEKIYHVPGGRYYDRVIPERWFFTEEEARAAGFRPSQQ